MMKKEHSKVDELKKALEKRKNIDEKKGQKKTHESEDSEKHKDFKKLSQQLQGAEKEAKAHYDKLLRVMAELDNFKKRSDRERREVARYGNERLISDLLPILDDLNRVLDHVSEGASKELLDFVSGVQLVRKHFLGVLEKFGLKEVKSIDGKFNPAIHEAVAHIPNDEVEPDHIIEEHRKGYKLNDRVIRASMVSVSSGKNSC